MILYNTVVLLVLLGCLLMLLWNLSVFPTVPVIAAELIPGTDAPDAPFISVLVPARNEEHRIAPCASSLAAQNYPRFEVIVLDDHSEDGTAEVLRKLGYSEDANARLRLISGKPLPPGWTGKAWACHQLAQAAGAGAFAPSKPDYLFFTDADTEHTPEMLASTVALAREERADLLSAWPWLQAFTWSERLILPMIHLALVYYPHAFWQWIQADPAGAGTRAKQLPLWVRRGFGAANGQFLFFKREAYERIGGHEAVKNHMVEDVALGRAITARADEGLRLFNCDGSSVSRVRMYSCFAEIWEGLTKNIRAAFENSLPSYLFMGVWANVTFLFPFILVWMTHGAARDLVLAQIIVIYLIRVRLATRFDTSWLGCLLHPLAQILTTLIALNSWRCSAGKGVIWKGRRYEVVHPGEEGGGEVES